MMTSFVLQLNLHWTNDVTTSCGTYLLGSEQFELQNIVNKYPTNDQGKTPIDLAIQHGKLEIVSFLKGVNNLD